MFKITKKDLEEEIKRVNELLEKKNLIMTSTSGYNYRTLELSTKDGRYLGVMMNRLTEKDAYYTLVTIRHVLYEIEAQEIENPTFAV